MTPVTKRRPGRPTDETLRVRRCEEILDAAAPIFARYGYPNTDVQLIADALGVGKGTVYRYFPTKQELFLAAVDRGMHRLRDRVQAEAEAADPLDRLEKAIRAYLAFFRDHPHYVELLIQERAEFKDRKKQTYFVHREANAGPWRDLFRDLVAEGRVRNVPVERIMDVLGDLVYGTMFTNHFAGRHRPLEDQVRDVIDVLFHGILSDSGAPAARPPAGEPGGNHGNNAKVIPTLGVDRPGRGRRGGPPGGDRRGPGPGRSGRQPAPGPSARAGERQAVAVTTLPVTPRPVNRTVQIVGTFHGHDEVTITPKVEGRVEKIFHDLGDVVKPGEVLLQVEDVDHRLAVQEARRALELELAKLGLKELPVKDLDVTRLPTVVRAALTEKNTAARLERARRAGQGVSVEELEQMETDHQIAKATYQQMVLEAEATLAAARHKDALLESARQKLAETKVRVPDPSGERMKGVRTLAAGGTLAAGAEYVVAQRLVSEGEMVRAFPSVAVFRLVMDRPLKVVATVPERNTAEVRVGQPVDISVEAYPNETFTGTVARVNPTVDRVNRTFQVEVHVPNEARKLRAGSFAKASIFTHEDPKAPTVPEEALVTFAGVTKVFVTRDGVAHAVPVKTGMRLEVTTDGRPENWVEVSGDLRPGDQVVTSGHTQLAEGSAVRLRSQESGIRNQESAKDAKPPDPDR